MDVLTETATKIYNNCDVNMKQAIEVSKEYIAKKDIKKKSMGGRISEEKTQKQNEEIKN